MKKTITALLCLILTGCASTMPKEVDVPVAVCVSSTLPQRPDLPIAHLTKQSKPDDVIKAYAASIKVLQGYIAQLEIKLNALQCNEVKSK